MKRIFIRRTAVLEAIVLLLVIVLPILSEKAEAAGFQKAYVRLDRMKASTFASGLVCVHTPNVDTAGTENDVQVVFPSDFTVGTTLTDWAVSTANIPTGSTAWPGIGQATAANNTTKTVTFPSTTLSTNTLYCFQWTNSTAALQTGSAGANKTGTVTTRTSGPATIDSSAYATAVISDDQLVVSATVPATFSVAFGDGGDADANANTDSFTGNLTTTTTPTYGNTVTIGTNAGAGWIAWVKSTNTALNSLSTGATIDSVGSVDGTAETLGAGGGYVLDVDATTQGGGTGTMTIDTEYNGSTADQGGSLNSTVFAPIASANGTTDGDVFTLVEKARIVATQAAATDYTDTLTIVAAGQF